jgi:PKD repeat protein
VTAASLGDPEQVAAVTLHSLFTPAPDETLPTAAFTYSQPVYVNQTVVFTNLTTGAPPITSTWHFGDETGRFDAGTALIPVQHTYPGPGVYTVFLTATNSFGQSIFTDTISVDWAAKVYLPLVLKE